MKRDKMLKKLKEIKAITTNFVASYDMGLQFDVMTAQGVSTDIGNVINWPYYKLPITPELIKLKQRVANGEQVTEEDILNVEAFKDLLSYTDIYSDSTWVVEDDILKVSITNLLAELKTMDTNRDSFYAYADLEDWGDGTINLFKDYEDLCEFVSQAYSSGDRLYEEMDDDELLIAYETAKKNKWNHVNYKNCM